jgi:toxin ParE1/3/4
MVKRPRALADLGEIWSFTADDSIVNADAFAARIDETFQLLARQPRMGRPRPELGSDIRSFVVSSYVIFYCLGGDGIEIIRVLHGARDIEAIFRDEQ